MTKILINDKLCKGCEYCVKYCPKTVLKMGETRSGKGYFNPVATDEQACIACLMCATICPEGAIELEKGGE